MRLTYIFIPAFFILSLSCNSDRDELITQFEEAKISKTEVSDPLTWQVGHDSWILGNELILGFLGYQDNIPDYPELGSGHFILIADTRLRVQKVLRIDEDPNMKYSSRGYYEDQNSVYMIGIKEKVLKVVKINLSLFESNVEMLVESDGSIFEFELNAGYKNVAIIDDDHFIFTLPTHVGSDIVKFENDQFEILSSFTSHMETRDIHFNNSKEGFLLMNQNYPIEETRIYMTSDGGINWSDSVRVGLPEHEGSGKTLHVAGDNNFLVETHFDPFFSNDRGANWRHLGSEPEATVLGEDNKVYTLKNNGYGSGVSGENFVFLSSSDAGATWESHQDWIYGRNPYVYRSGADEVLLTMDIGLIYYSNNNGYSFSRIRGFYSN